MKRRLGLAGLLICVLVLVSKLFAHPTINILLHSPVNDEDLPDARSGQIMVNSGASGTRTIDLPDASAGLHYLFVLSAAHKIKVNPKDGDTFLATGLTLAMGDSLESDMTVGTLIEIVAIDTTNWLQIREAGTWTNGG